MIVFVSYFSFFFFGSKLDYIIFRSHVIGYDIKTQYNFASVFINSNL